MAGRYDFTIEQGTDFSRVLTWKDANGVAIDITGYTAALMARKTLASTPVISLTSGAGLTLGGAAGTITITLTDTATAVLDFETVKYNLEMESGSGLTTRLLEGYITLSKEYVR